MQITRSDGKLIEVDCNFFANEAVPDEFVIKHCMAGGSNPICPIFRECWLTYKRNPITPRRVYKSIRANHSRAIQAPL